MKFVPRRTQIIGRMVIKRSESQIILADETKVTKFVLVDAVGSDAAASGIKKGDLVVPKALGQIVLEGGTRFCPFLEEKDVGFFVRDVGLDELLVQTNSGARYVPFNSEDAAKSIGAEEVLRESEAA